MKEKLPQHPERLTPAEQKDLLDELVAVFNQPSFIPPDPISIPHQFGGKEDIEIAGFLTATLAWGQRPTMLASSRKLMALMDDAPADFIRHAGPGEWARAEGFVHRTFNSTDAVYFFRALQTIYREHGGLEQVVAGAVRSTDADVQQGLAALHRVFFSLPDAPARTRKHLSDVTRGAAAKRLNMYLRWMVRQDTAGVDFGLWRRIQPRQLLIPLDLHSGRIARRLGLLKRQQDDLRAVLELTETLRVFDAEDPVKYDFALFGLGASKWLDA